MNYLKNIDFGNETGDDADIEELRSYYVKQEFLDRFLHTKDRLLLALAKKGGGKSSLIEWSACELSENKDNIVIKLRGSDFPATELNFNSPANEFIRQWMAKICTKVNRELAKKIHFAFTDDTMALVESAEIEGFKQKNLISALSDRFLNKYLLGDSVKKEKASNEVELLKRLQSSMPNVWILVDDLDATFQNSELEKKELGTFFTACRYLFKDIKGIHFRVTMRSDVFPYVRRYDEAMDKMEQYIININWSDEDFLNLLASRVLACIKIFDPENTSLGKKLTNFEKTQLLEHIFDKNMEWNDKDVATYKVIHKISYSRPRWAIQLCKLAKTNSIKINSTKISKESIDSIWADYGKKRIADLVAEHKHQCPQVEDLINAFRDGERRMSRNDLFKLIQNKISNHITPIIDNNPSKDAKAIAHFLFRIGFLVGRHEETEYTYEHYHFEEMPDFLSSKTNDDHGVAWEIHPCFREALNIVKMNRARREAKGFIKNKIHIK